MSTIGCNKYDTNDCKQEKLFKLRFIDIFSCATYEKKININ